MLAVARMGCALSNSLKNRESEHQNLLAGIFLECSQWQDSQEQTNHTFHKLLSFLLCYSKLDLLGFGETGPNHWEIFKRVNNMFDSKSTAGAEESDFGSNTRFIK